MIDYVRALDVEEARELAKAPAAARAATLRSADGRIAWIGVEPGSSPLRHFIQPVQLVLRVPDTTHPGDLSRDSPAVWYETASRAGEWPDERMASTIAVFVHCVHMMPAPYALLVHCTAGRNRSPAIATWVQERYRVMPDEAFAKLHPKIAPNRTLLRLLRARREGL